MKTNGNEIVNGSFKKRQGFTITSNVAIRDKKLSLGAKGLYAVIMSFITMPDITLTKSFLMEISTNKEKSFNSLWKELKNAGYLKVYMKPSPTSGWIAQYELLDEPKDVGLHSYYLDVNGNITNTNESIKENKRLNESVKECKQANNQRNDDNAIKIEKNKTDSQKEERIPLLGIYAKGIYAKGIYAKGGNNIKPSYNTSSNTYNNTLPRGDVENFVENSPKKNEEAIQPQKGEGGIERENKVKSLSYSEYRNIVNNISDRKFRKENPYTTKSGAVDKERMDAFDLCENCIIEMLAAKKKMQYRGVFVTAQNVYDAVSNISNGFEDGGLLNFMDFVTDQVAYASRNGNIANLKNYTKAIIWNSFSTYKLSSGASFLY